MLFQQQAAMVARRPELIVLLMPTTRLQVLGPSKMYELQIQVCLQSVAGSLLTLLPFKRDIIFHNIRFSDHEYELQYNNKYNINIL